MRLINTTTRAFEEFIGRNIPQYAILSHTWEEEEVSCANYLEGRHLTSQMKGYAKIDKTCEMAAKAGIQYAWVDTCCIDKRSSAELTEAINSMFRWYERAEVCYAFLSDLPPRAWQVDTIADMRECKWFTRGWTLQELIAPRNVKFFNSAWKCKGSKDSLFVLLSDITGIPEGILSKRDSLALVPVAQKMSWVATRLTTRVEDIAYCLLGLFDVNMPLLYGEEDKAFIRLQEEIIKHTPDLTILTWKLPQQSYREPDSRIYCGVLAESPSCFSWCRRAKLVTRPPRNTFSMSNDRVIIHSTIVACKTSRGLQPEYVLPTHQKTGPRTSDFPVGVALRKVADGQFLRSDPHKLYEMEYDSRYYNCYGAHQLLIKPPVPRSSQWLSIMPSSRVTEEYLSRLRPRSIRIRLGPNIDRQSVSPRSRFDDADGIFFVSDEVDDQNDWGMLNLSVGLDLGGKSTTTSSQYVFCATSWGPLSAPQCSIIPTVLYAQQLIDMRSKLSQWDHSTDDVLSALARHNIPCAHSAIVDVPGTCLTAVVSFEVSIREDVPPWMPRGSAWDVHIRCSVHKSDCVPLTTNNSRWESYSELDDVYDDM